MSSISSDAERVPERAFVVVVGVDLRDQDSSGYAFDQAMRMASRIDRSEAHVVYVVPDDVDDEHVHEFVGLLELYVSEKAAVLGMRGPRRGGIHVRRGDSADGISQLASDVGADMIVVGTKAPHLSSLWGSTARRVMTATSCPVFVAGPKPKPQPSHIITIEPPCPDCVERRFETQGRTWWCDRHSERHHLRHHHVYSYQAAFPFAQHDSEVMPTGTD